MTKTEIDEMKRKRLEIDRIEAAFNEDIEDIVQRLKNQFIEGKYLCELNEKLKKEISRLEEAKRKLEQEELIIEYGEEITYEQGL